jgi:hypothetical protein
LINAKEATILFVFAVNIVVDVDISCICIKHHLQSELKTYNRESLPIFPVIVETATYCNSPKAVYKTKSASAPNGYAEFNWLRNYGRSQSYPIRNCQSLPSRFPPALNE